MQEPALPRTDVVSGENVTLNVRNILLYLRNARTWRGLSGLVPLNMKNMNYSTYTGRWHTGCCTHPERNATMRSIWNGMLHFGLV
jgi:hypothetical protein